MKQSTAILLPIFGACLRTDFSKTDDVPTEGNTGEEKAEERLLFILRISLPFALMLI